MERRDGAERFRRRAITIPAIFALAALIWVALPLLLTAALAIDLARRQRLARVRLVAIGAVYVAVEVCGLAACFVLWLACGPWRSPDRERFLDWNYRLQSAWASTLFAAVRAIFGLRIVVEGAEQASSGPLLVFPRHAAFADVLLPAVEIAVRRRMRLRWVLKRELLVDPCLDVAGHRLPNVFVDRSAVRSGREIAAVRGLAKSLGARDGVLIYPEGSRFTPAKQQQAFDRLAAHHHTQRLAQLRRLRHLLPPRTGGPLALLEAAPGADVLILGHVGLDGFADLRLVLSGALVGRTVRVRFWRHAAASVPREREAALAWLDARWLELDGWVHDRLAPADAR